MDYQLIIVIVIVVLFIGIFLSWYVTYSKRKKVVISALIDVYTTGRHHVEFIPVEGTHPVDLVQLVISYISHVIMLTKPYEITFVDGLYQLFELNRKHYDLEYEFHYRQELTTLVNTPPPSLLESGKLSAGNSDRYQVRLIRGKQFDYSLTQFSMYSYKPNLANSALYLYHTVVTKLDSDNLKLLHTSLALLNAYYHDTKPTMSNNQAIAFTAVEYAFSVLPKPIENSPGRISRKP